MNPMKSHVFSSIRLLHASPDAPPVDVYANDHLIARNLPYKGFTPYLPISAGEYTISIFPTGKKQKPVLVKNIKALPNTISTIAVINSLSDIDLLAVPEPIQPIPHNKTMVRFVHLSPNTPSVDISLPDKTKLFEDVEYKEITKYIPVSPATYTIEASPTGTDDIVLHVPNIKLKPNKFYTIYAVGFLEGNPPLQVLIPLDGNTYIKF